MMNVMRDLTLADVLLADPRFHLTGSRYFAQKFPVVIVVSDSTDWDFYCAPFEGHFDVLDELGFKLTVGSNLYPYDDLACNIFVAPGCQVITRSDVDLYTKTIESINPVFYRDYLWKSGPNKPGRDQIQATFNQLFRTAK
jgi:hypothetical protein